MVLSCATARFPDTGITNLTATCDDGTRPILDCAKDYEQFTRNMRADIAVFKQAAGGFGFGANQLMQLDSITGDLLAHRRQICVDYNNCLISKEEYRTESTSLRKAQLKVREATSQFSSYGYPAGIGYGMPTQPAQTSTDGEAPKPPETIQQIYTDVLESLKLKKY
jgi:hypothetical protein